MPSLNHVSCFWVLAALTVCQMAVGDEPKPPGRDTRAPVYNPPIAAASDEAQKAIRSFRIPAGLKVDLFAAEPLLANPVAFCVDDKGVFYVAETFRHSAGVPDTRGHMDWLDDDLACRTVDERVAMYRKYLGKSFADYQVEHERVRRIVDTNGDARADSATVFADGFNDPAAGIGAGLLARKSDVWYACIPALWKLRDTNGDGVADDRAVLQHGYGVHVGFLGHDLHGLIFGPDGRLYFSMGDRGLNVKTGDGRAVSVPDTGSVLRCNRDGSELEVFATGLRNPQELAFDQFGNLFTADNNSDSGDQARWVYVVEGGDSGWRIGYQWLESPYSRGPWNEEKLWHPHFAGQAAWIVPPIANIADGPSGLVFNPGVTLLPDEYKNHFFLVDFRGSSGQSGIRAFSQKPSGSSFELVNPRQFLWSVLATDVDFGPDGSLYFSDWVEGWEKPKKGRIYRAGDASRHNDPAIKEVKTILAEGMTARSLDGLAALLTHADMRVRQEAQFELAGRGASGLTRLEQAAKAGNGLMGRVHAIWGMGQVARADRAATGERVYKALEPQLADPDAEIRAQAARVLGDLREGKAFAGLVGLLKDASPRVRMLAAIALGRLGHAEATGPILEMLRSGSGEDPYLRHAAVMGLVGSGDVAGWRQRAHDRSPAVRMGILLAMRRSGKSEVAQFLSDPEPALVLEAARAINDAAIDAAMPALAAMPMTGTSPLPLVRRILNANFRLGQAEQASRLSEAAGRADLATAARVLALSMLSQWAKPSGRDQVVGLWRPIPPRPAQPAAQALRPRLDAILAAAPAPVLDAAIDAIASLHIDEAGARLADLVASERQPDATRAQALEALDRLNHPRKLAAAQRALILPGFKSRTQALRVLAKVDPAAALAPITDLLEHGSTTERQGAIAVLGALPGAAATHTLSMWLDRLNAGQVPGELRLDLVEAAIARNDPELRRKVDRFEASKPKDDLLAPYRETLAGGDALRGHAIFTSKAEVECLRCHKVKGPTGETTGGEVGPELSGIGARQTRDYLLQSIVEPNKQIAQGFETVVLATSDGKVHTGVLRGEDDTTVRIITPEGKPVVVPKDTIEERKRGPSAMPADLAKKLSRAELRDLIEFLASLKTPANAH